MKFRILLYIIILSSFEEDIIYLLSIRKLLLINIIMNITKLKLVI